MLKRFNKTIHNGLVLSPFLSLALLFLLLITPSFMTSAARYPNAETDFVVGVDKNITITLPKNDISLMIDPSSDEVYMQSFDIGVFSNNAHGVMLGMTTVRNRTSSSDQTATGLNSVHNNTIPALYGAVSGQDFPANYWGYSLDDGTTFRGIPAANDGKYAEIDIKDPEDSGYQKVVIGAKADASQAADFYYNTISIFATTRVPVKTIEDIFYMQEMNSEIYDSMVVEHQYRLRDMRDNNDYWVAKFQDGTVWMTENLALALSPDMTLTQWDTDLIDRSWTPTTTKTAVNPDVKDVAPNSAQKVTIYNYDSNGAQTQKTDYQDGSNYDRCVSIHFDDPKYCDHYLRGIEYSVPEALVATALDNGRYDIYNYASGQRPNYDFDESICPAGWRLPRNSSVNGKNEFPETIGARTYTEQDEQGRTILQATFDRLWNHPPFYMLIDKDSYTSYDAMTGSYITGSTSNDQLKTYNVTKGFVGTQRRLSLSVTDPTQTGYDSRTFYVRCVARPTNRFTIEYDLNGGEGQVPSLERTESWQYETAYEINGESSATKEGYALVGWATSPDAASAEVVSRSNSGNAAYADESGRILTNKITLTKSVTKLYAVWEKTVDAVFHANGGKFNQSDDTIRIAYTEPSNSAQNLTERKSFSSHDEKGVAKSWLGDQSTFPVNTVQYEPIVNSSYAGATAKIKIYYAVPSDSVLCITTKGMATGNSQYNTYSCTGSESKTSNLSSSFTPTYNASSIYNKTYENRLTVSSSSALYVYFRSGETNGDDKDTWYGYWIDVDIEYKDRNKPRTIYTSITSPSTPTRENYTFLGWSTNPNATEPDYYPNNDWRYLCGSNGGEYCNENVELYAVWVSTNMINVNFVSQNPEKLQITMPSTVWYPHKGGLYLGRESETGSIFYDDCSSGSCERVYVASINPTTGAFYKGTVQYSPKQSYYLGDLLDMGLRDGDTLTITLNYDEEMVTTMQGMDSYSCVTAAVGTTDQLTDARDGKVYWIEKLADNHCWMVQNLDLYLATGSAGTIVDNQTIYITDSWDYNNDSNNNQYLDGGDYYYPDGIHAVSTEGLAPDATEWHYHRGSLYNRHVSTYMCPPNWTLGNFKALYDTYGLNQPDAYTFNFTGNTILQAPFYQVLDVDDNLERPDIRYDYTKQQTTYWTNSRYSDTIFSTNSSNTPLGLKIDWNTEVQTATVNNTGNSRQAGYIRCMR